MGVLRDTVVALVRRDGPDLSARQLGVFLTCYLQEGAHTVRGLAAELNVSKPAITRALDRLAPQLPDGSIILVGERLATSPGPLSAAARPAKGGKRLAWNPRPAGERRPLHPGRHHNPPPCGPTGPLHLARPHSARPRVA